MKNKKAQISQLVLYYIPRIFFTVIVLFSIIALVSSFIISNVNVTKTEAEVYNQALLYSKNGLSYYDHSIGRIYPGVFNVTNVNETEKVMNERLSFGEKQYRMGARITYYIDVDDEFIRNAANERGIYYNEQFFNLLEAKQDLIGPGGSYIKVNEFDTLFIFNNDYYNGRIKIEVAVPNE